MPTSPIFFRRAHWFRILLRFTIYVSANCVFFDWCCFYYFLRNSLVALLESLFARIFLDLRYRCAVFITFSCSTPEYLRAWASFMSNACKWAGNLCSLRFNLLLFLEFFCLPLLRGGSRNLPHWIFGCEGLSPVFWVLPPLASVWWPWRLAPYSWDMLFYPRGCLPFSRREGWIFWFLQPGPRGVCRLGPSNLFPTLLLVLPAVYSVRFCKLR